MLIDNVFVSLSTPTICNVESPTTPHSSSLQLCTTNCLSNAFAITTSLSLSEGHVSEHEQCLIVESVFMLCMGPLSRGLVRQQNSNEVRINFVTISS